MRGPFALTVSCLVLAALLPDRGNAQRVDCTLASRPDGTFQGLCAGFDEGRGTLELRPDQPVAAGPSPMAVPTDIVWSGTLQIPRWPTLPIEMESVPYEPEPGLVLKTQVAWVRVEEPLVDQAELAFWFQWDEDAPPSRDDLEILERTEAILSDERVWDRSANRRCTPRATTWTLFCALRDATVEVTGEFHERQPALVILESVINDVFREMGFQDPLVDYNTYEDAILVEMHRLLGNAASRVRSAL